MRPRSRKSLERPRQAGEQPHPEAATPIAGGRKTAHKLRGGGIAPDGSDPLGRAALRESYGARSGEAPEAGGTPATVTGAGRRDGARTARRRGRGTGSA